MRKQEFYCDCCNGRVKSDDSLTNIWITFGSSEGYTNKEVCFDCWKEYTNKIAKIAKAMFKE